MDTERTTPELIVALADNAVQAISPQDIRDLLASLAGGYGEIRLSTASAPATILAVGTSFVLIGVADVVSAQSSDVNADGIEANLTPTYDMAIGVDGLYRVCLWASFGTSVPNKTVTLCPHVNGSPVALEADRKLSSGDAGVASMECWAFLSAGDLVDFRCKIDSATSNIIFYGLGFSIKRVG